MVTKEFKNGLEAPIKINGVFNWSHDTSVMVTCDVKEISGTKLLTKWTASLAIPARAHRKSRRCQLGATNLISVAFTTVERVFDFCVRKGCWV